MSSLRNLALLALAALGLLAFGYELRDVADTRLARRLAENSRHPVEVPLEIPIYGEARQRREIARQARRSELELEDPTLEDIEAALIADLFEDPGSPFSLFDLARYPARNLPTLENLERFLARGTDENVAGEALEVWSDFDRRAGWVRLTEIQAVVQFVAAHPARVNAALEDRRDPAHLSVEVAELAPFLTSLGIDSGTLYGALDAEALRAWTEANRDGTATERLVDLDPAARELLELLTAAAATTIAEAGL